MNKGPSFYEPLNLQCPGCYTMWNTEDIVMGILNEPDNGDIITCSKCKCIWACTPLIKVIFIKESS